MPEILSPEDKAQREEAEKQVVAAEEAAIRLHRAEEDARQQQYVRPWVSGWQPPRPAGTPCSVCSGPFTWNDAEGGGDPLYCHKHNTWQHRSCFERGEHEICAMQTSF